MKPQTKIIIKIAAIVAIMTVVLWNHCNLIILITQQKVLDKEKTEAFDRGILCGGCAMGRILDDDLSGIPRRTNIIETVFRRAQADHPELYSIYHPKDTPPK